MKVLVIDIGDNYEYLYRKKLNPSKFDIDFISKTSDLENKLQKYTYELLLVGHYLKKSSGKEICDKARRLGYTGNIIIMAPGNHLKQIQELYTTSITGVMNKASNTEDFTKEINKFIKKFKYMGEQNVPTA